MTAEIVDSRILRRIPLLIAVCLVGIPVHAKYGGGSGTAADPYQIATAADLIGLGEDPNDYNKHFILTADIDLAGHVFDKAVIAPASAIEVSPWVEGTPFAGVFDGNGHTISHLTITGADYLGLFGRLASGAEVKNLGIPDANVTPWGGPVGGLVGYNSASITNCYSTGVVKGDWSVGGLVGYNQRGDVAHSYSTATVTCSMERVGGLIGRNTGSVLNCCAAGGVTGRGYAGGLLGDNSGNATACYSTGAVSGNDFVGGLVGWNGGSVTRCYSTGTVSGTGQYVGGLVGSGSGTCSFWDVQTSGQTKSAGGTGKTTVEMKTAGTFVGWGGPVWTIDEGKDYPHLWWQDMPGKPIPNSFGAGMGTESDPYLIYTAEELNTLGLYPCEWDKHFKLMADIDLSAFDGKDGRPAFNIIGTGYYPFPFTGVFDGNGHKLYNYRGSNALFGAVRGSNAEIKNLVLIKPDVVGEDARSLLVGQLDDGTISNCYVQDCNLNSNSSAFPGSSAGGLVLSNNGTITDCHISGQINGTGHVVGGLVSSNDAGGTITRCSFSGTVRGLQKCGSRCTGGLVGDNHGGISFCYSTGSVLVGCGTGGLVGWNYGVVYSCYSTSDVQGKSSAGGLVGDNLGIISNCYSTGTVSGITEYSTVGGLVVSGSSQGVTASFWDIQTSGQKTSAGGTGKTTAEMQTAKTFLDAGWDFVGETVNGTEDIWWIREGHDYPRLWWEWERPWAIYPNPANGASDVIHRPILSWYSDPRAVWHDVYFGEDHDAVASATTASLGIYGCRQAADVNTYDPGTLEWGKTYYWRIDEVNEADPNSPWKGDISRFTTTDCIKSPQPLDGATEVILSPILSWVPGGPGLQYDVYFGGDEQAVANATPQSPGIYRGRQPSEMTTYEPACLKGAKTYYWRIDGLDEGDPNGPWKGDVWSFTMADFIVVTVVDDFESYTSNPATGPLLLLTWIGGFFNGTGSMVLFAEQTIVHGGKQSMPMEYNNVREPWYSEAERTWEAPQDWTTNHADTLTLYLRGKADNGRDSLYVAIEDSAGQIVVVVHPDASAVLTSQWQAWHIPLPDVKAAGVNVAAVKKMYIGVGDRDNPQPGGTGRIYIDDIRLTWRFLLVDFDGDMDTDFLDFCILAEHWLQPDSSFWCGAGGTDLTNDGKVDLNDLRYLAENWLAIE